ncbi:hypothetical protein [Lysinibacillus sp. RC79]|uniref:hypothetical protein n=1 Tax=Lysinibacillus sp. RC79 TaxID=3156296 RepID=UPI003514647B
MADGLFGGGNGSELNPFLVEDLGDFLAIRNFIDTTGILAFKQIADIDLKGITDFEYFNLPSVDLMYDGSNHQIKNLFYHSTNDSACIFYMVSSIKMSNVIFKNINLKSDFSVGIVGYISDTTSKGHKFENVRALDSTFISNGNSSALLIAVSSNLGTGDLEFIRCSVKNCVIKGYYVTGIAHTLTSHKITISQCEILDSSFGAYTNGYLYTSFFIYASQGNGIDDVLVEFSNCYAKGNSIDMSNVTDTLYASGFINSYRNWYNFQNGNTYIEINQCYLDNDLAITHQKTDPFSFGIYFGGFAGNAAWDNQGSLNICDSFLLGNVDISHTDQIGWGIVGEAMVGIAPSKFQLNIINTKKVDIFSLPSNQPYNSGADNQIPNTVKIGQSKQKSTYIDGASWDFNDIWSIRENVSTPTFKLKRITKKCIRRPIPNYRWKTGN